MKDQMIPLITPAPSESGVYSSAILDLTNHENKIVVLRDGVLHTMVWKSKEA